MAYIKCGSNGGTLAVQDTSTNYTSGNSISCSKGDLLIFVGNFNTFTPTNMDYIGQTYAAVVPGTANALAKAFIATSTTCSLAFTTVTGQIGYMVLS